MKHHWNRWAPLIPIMLLLVAVAAMAVDPARWQPTGDPNPLYSLFFRGPAGEVMPVSAADPLPVAFSGSATIAIGSLSAVVTPQVGPTGFATDPISIAALTASSVVSFATNTVTLANDAEVKLATNTVTLAALSSIILATGTSTIGTVALSGGSVEAGVAPQPGANFSVQVDQNRGARTLPVTSWTIDANTPTNIGADLQGCRGFSLNVWHSNVVFGASGITSGTPHVGYLVASGTSVSWSGIDASSTFTLYALGKGAEASITLGVAW